VQRLDGLSRLFLIAVVVYVTGRCLDHPLIPWSGSAAVIALAGLVWARPLPRGAARWTRIPLVAGLALLAFVLCPPGLSGLFREAVQGTAYAAIAVGVLGRAGRLIRWGNLPAAGFAVLVTVAAVGIARHPDVLPWQVAPDLNARTYAALTPALVLITVGFAVNAALVSRRALRWAAAGLLPVLVLALSLLPAVLGEERFSPQARPEPAARFDFTVTSEPESPVLRNGTAPSYPPRPLLIVPELELPPIGTPPAIAAPPQPSPIEKAVSARYDLHAALSSGLLLIGLDAVVTTLFPYRE
jgi:hypothetical protein